MTRLEEERRTLINTGFTAAVHFLGWEMVNEQGDVFRVYERDMSSLGRMPVRWRWSGNGFV